MVSHRVQECYTVLEDAATRCYIVLKFVTQFYRVLAGLKKCYTVVHPFVTQCYRVLRGGT